MVNGFFDGIDHAYGHFIVEVFRTPIAFLCGQNIGQNRLGAFVAVQRHVLFREACGDFRERLCRNIGVHNQTFRRIAYGYAGGFGVKYNFRRHICIRVAVNIYMAVSCACFNHGNGCVFHHRTNQPRTAARNQHIYIARKAHQCGCAFPRGIFHKLYAVGREFRFPKGVSHNLGNRGVGMNRLFAAAQKARTARF